MTRSRHNRERADSKSMFEPLEGRRLMAAGALDTSFSGDGKQVIDLGNGEVLEALDVAVQSNGKTVIVGKRKFADGRRSDFATARLNSDGSLDKTFGPAKTGLVTNDPGNASESFAEAVAIQSDGKIVVVGTAEVEDIGFNEPEMAIVRYLPDGRLDSSFDDNGMRTLDLGNFSSFTRAHDVAIQSNGKIVVVGMTYRAPDTDFFAVRFNSDGALDGSFDGDGKKFIGFGNNDDGQRVGIDGSGRIYVAGHVDTEFNQILRVGLVRLNGNGDRDGTFGEEGQLEFNIPGRAKTVVTGVLVQGAKVILSGHVLDSNNQHDFYVARFNADGKLDTSFGGQGTGFRVVDLGGNDVSGGITNAPSGSGFFVSGGSGGFALAKFTQNGLPDNTFGTAGKVRLPGFGGAARVFAGSGRRLTLAGGSRFSSARILDSGANVVSVGAIDSLATEGPFDKGSLLITRSERLPERTKVFFDISGTATHGADYVDGLTRQSTVVINGKVLPVINPKVFVEIPENQTFVIVPVSALEDQLVEGPESATFTIQPSSAYELGTNPSATVDIANSANFRINFQAPGATPEGFVADTGQAFGPRANGASYGWDSNNTADAVTRNNSRSPNALLDSFNHMQLFGTNRKWEIAVPNGLYQVELAAGDPSFVNSNYALNLEDRLVLRGSPVTGSANWFRTVVNVQVSDGRLTLSNGASAVNNKINFMSIRPAAPGATPGVVSEVKPVGLLPLQTVVTDKLKNVTPIFSLVKI